MLQRMNTVGKVIIFIENRITFLYVSQKKSFNMELHDLNKLHFL